MLTAQQARALAESKPTVSLETVLDWIENKAKSGGFDCWYSKTDLSIETIEDLKIAGYTVIVYDENINIKW